MKKILLFTLASLLGLQSHAETTLDRIKSSGKITIGYRSSAEPISYKVDEKPVGYAIDICNNVAASIKKVLNKPNLQVNYEPVYPMTRVPAIMTGQVDLECGTTTNTKQKKELVDFSTSYFITEVKLAIKSNTPINNLHDLNGKVIVTAQGTTADDYIRALKRNNSLSVKNIFGSDNDEAFALLASGRASAILMDDNTLASLIAKSGNPEGYKIIDPTISTEPYGVMIAKNNPQLKSIIDSVITSMWLSGDMNKLYKKWFQSPIPPKNLNFNIPPNQSFKDFQKSPNDNSIN